MYDCNHCRDGQDHYPNEQDGCQVCADKWHAAKHSSEAYPDLP